MSVVADESEKPRKTKGRFQVVARRGRADWPAACIDSPGCPKFKLALSKILGINGGGEQSYKNSDFNNNVVHWSRVTVLHFPQSPGKAHSADRPSWLIVLARVQIEMRSCTIPVSAGAGGCEDGNALPPMDAGDDGRESSWRSPAAPGRAADRQDRLRPRSCPPEG